ncbi:velvet factor-domain-containing protein [Mycena capillaripes]|nr:velvet factor-domain-containing protein [Mycena capillaripes]
MQSVSSWSPSFTHSELTAPSLQLQIKDHFPLHCVPQVDWIGIPIHFTEGRFSGQIVRAELHEIQRPKYGRRFGAVDKRVLDDPPVAQLRLFNVYNAGTTEECEQEVQNYDDISLPGLICMVDLFEISKTPSAPSSPQSPPSSFLDDPDFYATEMTSTTTTPSCMCDPSSHQLPPDTLVLIDGYLVTERAKRTVSLFGTKFVEPHKIDYPGNGQKQIMFTFSDLAVRLEGYFTLRYRFFDIFYDPTGKGSSPVLAECYGGPFRMYSSKEAPSLRESTTLTTVCECIHLKAPVMKISQCLANSGVPVKVRTKRRSPRRNKT